MPRPCSNDCNQNEGCSLTIEEEIEIDSSDSSSSSTGILSTTSSSSVQSTAERVDSVISDVGSSSTSESLSIDLGVNEEVLCGVRVCNFSEEEENSLQTSCEIGYVNSSGLANCGVWSDGIRLSEMLQQPVTAIPNAGGLACALLTRGMGLSCCSSISQYHPTVRSLLGTWSRFFQRCASGSFLLIYNGDGGLFVERALQLIQCQEWLSRIRVVGINPSFFVTSTLNSHFYLSPGNLGMMLDVSGFVAARQRGCISRIPFSPYTQSIFPEVWDSCFEFALRLEFMRLAGVASLSAASSPVSDDSCSSRLQLVRVVSSEESVGFTRLQDALSQDMTSSVHAANPFPLPHMRLILLLTGLARHTLTTSKAVYSYSPSSWEALDMFDAMFTASYIGGVFSEIFLLCTNRPDRASRMRLIRMLARLFGSWSWLAGIMELSSGYVVTIRLLLQSSPGSSCIRNMLFWMESCLTPVILLDISERNCPRVWSRVVGLGMRITTPAIYREERERNSRSSSQGVSLVNGRLDRYGRRQHAAVGGSLDLISLTMASLVQLMFVGIDAFSLRFPEACRRVPCNNTSSPNSTVIANNTTGCVGGSMVKNVFPQITGVYESDLQTGSVARLLNTIRMIWCGVMLLYFLYTAFRLVRNSRRGN